MTDRGKCKTEFGADEEAERVLNKLPRKRHYEPNAFVHIDASGRLVIILDGGGALTINERHLAVIHGDELYEG